MHCACSDCVVAKIARAANPVTFLLMRSVLWEQIKNRQRQQFLRPYRRALVFCSRLQALSSNETGQWSEPNTAVWMAGLLMLEVNRSLTRT